MVAVSRRHVLQAAAIAPLAGAAPGWAAEADSVTIGWPSDVTSWDPNQRFTPDAHSIMKAVFDQPLDQDAKLKLSPSLITKWEMAADAKSLTLDFRDDVLFHDGSKMTAADFRWTFFERIKAGHKVDIAQSMRKVTDIEVVSPTRAIMRFDSPAPTVPVWLAFLGSFLVPKAYMEKVGVEEFARKPVGTGPYKLVEHQMNARIVLERNEAYWGPKPKMKRVTIEIIKDPSARVAAVQSGQVDITINVPVREVTRLKALPGKKALSTAFYAGAAVPLSVLGVPGSPGYLDDYKFDFDPEKAKALLAKSGYSLDKPAKIRMASTNGQFPSDYDIARAIVQMWKKVGIEAELEVIEYAKYFELNRGNKLPETTLYTFDNATGDPERYTGYLLNPKLPFSPWKDMTFGQKVIDQFNVADEKTRIAGWRALNREASEMGAAMPLLQSVLTVVRKKGLAVVPYGNGWILPQAMTWS